ncbi:MAG TPA: hypothetical protein VGF48_05065 [Thermoanaerobaculia bacterium]|jgi:hypothetical protein
MRRVVSANDKRTEFLARSLVNRLEDRGVIDFGDAEAAILVVTRTLADNFAIADAIELEARGRVKKKASEEELWSEMRRIAAERNFIL